MTAKQYLAQLQALLPPGGAWTREQDADLTGLLHGLAEELARIDARCEDLLNEADPRTTVELLPDWERVFGLPDPCTGVLGTLQERQAALTAKVAAIGGQSPPYFVGLAASLGYTVTIDKKVGGDPFTWRVNAPETTIRSFRVGQSVVGEQLRTWGNTLLECVIRRYQPAEGTVLFGYS